MQAIWTFETWALLMSPPGSLVTPLESPQLRRSGCGTSISGGPELARAIPQMPRGYDWSRWVIQIFTWATGLVPPRVIFKRTKPNAGAPPPSAPAVTVVVVVLSDTAEISAVMFLLTQLRPSAATQECSSRD